MDGGMGTTLEDRGINTRTPIWGSFALLSEKGRTITAAIHRDFVAAGAQILIANNHNAFFSACEEVLELDELRAFSWPESVAVAAKSKRASALHAFLNDEALAIARAAAVTPPFGSGHGTTSAPDTPREGIAVATCLGSVEGPYATQSGMSTDDACGLLEREIAARVATGKADLFLFETLTTRAEIEGAARAAHRLRLDNVAVGVTCGADGHTLGGVDMDAAVAAFAPVDPLAFFVQCTRYDLVVPALERLVELFGDRCAVGVYANDGRRWDPVRMRWAGERITSEDYRRCAGEWLAAGACIIGGCCGTSPEHVAGLRDLTR